MPKLSGLSPSHRQTDREDHSQVSTLISEFISSLCADELITEKEKDAFRVFNASVAELSGSLGENVENKTYLDLLKEDRGDLFSILTNYFNLSSFEYTIWSYTVCNTLSSLFEAMAELSENLTKNRSVFLIKNIYIFKRQG